MSSPAPARSPEKDTPPARSHGRLIAFCSVMAVLYGLGVFWAMPSVLNPASDSTAPLGPLNWIARYRDTSVSYIYPPVHQLVCLAFYGVVLLAAKAAGLIGAISTAYPYGFHDPTLVFSSLIVVTNLIALAAGVGLLVLMRQFRLTRETNSWYAMSLLGLGGVFAYYARVGNLDMPYMFWVVVSFACVWRYLFARPARKLLVLAAAAGALAIGTKDQAIGVEFGLGLTLLLVLPENSPGGLWPRIKNAAVFGCTLPFAYLLTSVAVNPWRWWAHIVFVTSDHVIPEAPNTLRGQLQVLAHSALRTGHVLSYGGLVLGALGVYILLRRGLWRKTAVLLIPPAAYYVSIIMRVRSTEERYLLPIAFSLALAAGAAAGSLLEGTRLSRAARLAVMGLLAAILADQVIETFVPVTYCQLFDARGRLARDLPALVPPGSSILMVRMSSFNFPDRRVYDRYSLMLPPGKRVTPPSIHGEHVLKPYDPGYRYVLAGNTLPLEPWPATGSLIRSWTYPKWMTDRIYVPCVYELSLRRRPD